MFSFYKRFKERVKVFKENKELLINKSLKTFNKMNNFDNIYKVMNIDENDSLTRIKNRGLITDLSVQLSDLMSHINKLEFYWTSFYKLNDLQTQLDKYNIEFYKIQSEFTKLLNINDKSIKPKKSYSTSKKETFNDTHLILEKMSFIEYWYDEERIITKIFFNSDELQQLLSNETLKFIKTDYRVSNLRISAIHIPVKFLSQYIDDIEKYKTNYTIFKEQTYKHLISFFFDEVNDNHFITEIDYASDRIKVLTEFVKMNMYADFPGKRKSTSALQQSIVGNRRTKLEIK